METEELTLADDAARIGQLVRILGASVNVRILRLLAAARREGVRRDDDRPPGQGWLYLSEISKELDEAPGTVGAAVQKLLPLLEEARHKGRRYFRSRIESLSLVLDMYPRDDLF